MNRVLVLAPLVFAVLGGLGLAGCEQKSGDRASPSATGSGSAGATATGVAAPTPEVERVEKTNVLDLELATLGTRYTVRNPGFEVTFPARPNLAESKDRAPDGTELTSALGLASSGGEELGFFRLPIPPGVAYDVQKGLSGARDGALKNIGATLLSETPAQIGGVTGTKVSAKATQGARTMYVDLYLVWDEHNRAMIGVFNSSTTQAPSEIGRAFVGSVKLKRPAGAAATPGSAAGSAN